MYCSLHSDSFVSILFTCAGTNSAGIQAGTCARARLNHTSHQCFETLVLQEAQAHWHKHLRVCRSPDLVELGQVRVEAAEFLNQPPHGDDEEEDVDEDDDAHGTEETPDEAVCQRQPAASETKVCVSVGGGMSP